MEINMKKLDKSDVRQKLFKIEILRRWLLQPQFIALGLTVGEGQPRILKALYTKGSMMQRELADICLIDTTTISRTLDKMERAGLIKRTSKPNCRRSWLIELTPDGRRKAENVIDIFKTTDDTFCKGLSNEELEYLINILDKIEVNLEGNI